MNYYFIFFIITIIIIINYFSHQNFKDYFTSNKKLNFNMLTLTTTIENNIINFIYWNDNFYFTNQPEYIFSGEFVSNGLIKLKNTFGNMDFILNYNIDNTTYSKILKIVPEKYKYDKNLNTLENIFNTSDKHIYFDPVNKIILSNDNYGNFIYLTFNNFNYPVSWNYNLDSATIFNVNYIKS